MNLHEKLPATAPTGLEDAYETLFRGLFHEAPYGILVCDAAGAIAYANRRTGDMFGYDAEELGGNFVETLVPGRFRSEHVKLRSDYSAHPEQRSMGSGRDLTGRRKDGVEFPLEIGLASITTDQGRFTCATVVDITDRKRQESKLRDANVRLEEFVRVASHDLRSPLRGIASLAEIIRESFDSAMPDTLDRNLTRIVERLELAEATIDDLLIYARAGHEEINLESISLDAIIAEVLAWEQAPEEVSIEVSASDEPFVGARVPLTLVLRNLFSNAIKHHDREKKHIVINARLDGAYCVIDLIDDGPGIPERMQERVFQLFQSTSSSVRRGAGLGLAVVHRVVEVHGGSVTLHSRDGERGCHFRVVWPRFQRSDTRA